MGTNQIDGGHDDICGQACRNKNEVIKHTIINKGSHWLHKQTNEFLTVHSIRAGRIVYQDNMGVKGSLPIEVFASTFKPIEDQ